MFRGEPAISQFDWPFTPIHTSSEQFSTHTGSGLHLMLLRFHPGHGQLTRFRVYPTLLIALFRLAFATAPLFLSLTLQHKVTRWRIMQKVRGCAYVYIASTACRHLVSVSISLPFRGSFHLSLAVLVHYRSSRQYLALPDGPGRFTRNFTCSMLLGCIDYALCINMFTRLSLSMAVLSRTIQL